MKKYALVEWTNEADAGSYSVVDSEWILGYTPEMYLIEWREGQGRKKPPPGGWPMGEAKVLQTSDKEAELKKALHDMTSIKERGDLVVCGKRKRIPKKRLYESDDETDTDAYRSSSGEEKRRNRGSKASEMSDPASSPVSPRKCKKRSPRSSQEPAQGSQNQEQDQDHGEMAQQGFAETSSDREVEDSTDDMTDGRPVTDMENTEEGSEADYPPEYELSELEKLRLEVRGLRDEIMLLRHQVCKELPKVHAIALKALGTQNNFISSIGCTEHADAAQSEARRQPSHSVKKNINTRNGRRRSTGVLNTGALKKEAEVFRQRVQLEKSVGEPTAVMTDAKGLKIDKTASPSPKKKQATQNSNEVEIYPGSRVFIEAEAWGQLNELDQPTAFARRLLPHVFSMETLLNSNLRGGKSTRDTAAEPKKALDQSRVDAIYKAVITKFPEISYCDIGQAINGRLSSIRYREQKRQKRITLQASK